MHHYTTESGSSSYDLGCIMPEVRIPGGLQYEMSYSYCGLCLSEPILKLYIWLK